MFDQNRLGHDGTKASRSGQPGNCDDQMEKEDDDFAHSGILSKPNRTRGFRNSPCTRFGEHVICRVYQGLNAIPAQ
jgi:hypothetical protein